MAGRTLSRIAWDDGGELEFCLEGIGRKGAGAALSSFPK